jgi:two-component system OmpR family sensor kinase
VTGPTDPLRRLLSAPRALHRRTPLRVRLLVALVALAAVGLAVAGVAVQSALRGYLVNRVDLQLEQQTTPPSATALAYSCLGADPGRFRGFGSFASDTQLSLLSATGQPSPCPAGSPAGTPADAPAPKVGALTTAEVDARGGHPFTVGSTRGSGQWRVVLIPFTDGTTVGTLVVAVSMADVDSAVSRLVVTDLVVSVSVLVLLAGLAYLVVRRTLRPLVAVEQTAEAIAAGDLTRRVPDGHPATEVGRLAGALNGMLAQIERAFRARETSESSARQSEERMRRFVADASHELRTPLTSIRGFAELYRHGGVGPGLDLDRAMHRIEAEAARMGLLVDDLLLLARLDQQRPLELAPVDLLALAADAAQDARAAAPGRPLSVELLPTDTPPEVTGDEARLRQVIGNLVSNALTHTPPATPVTLRVGADAAAGVAVLEVADRGPGLSAAEAARVFERFYRADSSRARSSGGSGLGLSIVAGLVAAHGGDVSVDSEPGHGAVFRVSLPLRATDPPGRTDVSATAASPRS